MNLYLIGYRGCGKSTVGKLVAANLDWPFIDTDQEIETLTGQTICNIFEEDGESVFREWESTVIEAVATRTQTIISLGGGSILADINRNTIKSNGWTVWLDAPAEVLYERIQQDEQSPATRPPLTELDELAEVKQGVAKRRNLYEACADYTVAVAELSPNQVADRIVNQWHSVDKDC